MSDADLQKGVRPGPAGSLTALSLAALGVVFGDIGTSPLYTLKTVLDMTGPHPDRGTILGSLSLIIWALILVTSLKYVAVAMRFDNEGEGGILALMALIIRTGKSTPVIIAFGLLGAALLYGDGAITPAISVLSAVEGMNIVTPVFAGYALPVSVAILVALFFIQPQGTARIGRAFGPVMLLWFATIGALGLWGIAQHPSVLVAISPTYGAAYLISHKAAGFLVLGGVFLCVTGAEALYADMGHFGPTPIRMAWACLVFPSLVLNYAGQAAGVLAGLPTADNIFYRLCPPALLLPLVVLATVATIIASQAIITGVFSMTRQAVQLGWLPVMRVTQTSAQGYGQIYVATVNWLLMLATCGLAIGFGKSDNLAAAYGIAVSATMVATSVLLFFAMRWIWGWSPLKAGAVAGVFLVVDLSFFTANLAKVAAGGYVPLLIGAFVYGVMLIWHRGAQAVSRRLQETAVPAATFLEQIAQAGVPRVPGTAVFLTRTTLDVPPVMVWHVQHNRALHERLLVLSVPTQPMPYLRSDDRLTFKEIAPHFWRAYAHYGFMERPDLPALLHQARAAGCAINFSDVTYYVGFETVTPRDDDAGVPRWLEAIYAFMQRNSVHVGDYLRIPQDSLVEIGRQISI